VKRIVTPRTNEARPTRAMTLMFKNVVLAGAATLTLVACGSPALKDAAINRGQIDANSRSHHAPRLPEPGAWQLIPGPTDDLHNNDWERRSRYASQVNDRHDPMNIKAITLATGVTLAAMTSTTTAGARSVQVDTPRAARSEVALIEQGSALVVHATVNGTATFTFQLDTGASIVVLPRGAAAKLITTADFLGMRTYVFGDGRQRVQPTYRLHSVTVGGLTATDVTCAIGDEEDTFLLGRSFLQQFKSWSIDNRRHVLALEN
jgi:clan AA aspartic protease (TIGR02281 family)